MTYNNQTNFEPADLAEGFEKYTTTSDKLIEKYKNYLNWLIEKINKTSDLEVKSGLIKERDMLRTVVNDFSNPDFIMLGEWIGQTINTERKNQVERKAEDASKDKALKVIAGILENHTTFGNITDAEFREAKELFKTIKL